MLCFTLVMGNVNAQEITIESPNARGFSGVKSINGRWSHFRKLSHFNFGGFDFFQIFIIKLQNKIRHSFGFRFLAKPSGENDFAVIRGRLFPLSNALYIWQRSKKPVSIWISNYLQNLLPCWLFKRRKEHHSLERLFKRKSLTLANHLARISNSDAICGNVLRYHTACSNGAIVANTSARANYDATSNPNIVTDANGLSRF